MRHKVRIKDLIEGDRFEMGGMGYSVTSFTKTGIRFKQMRDFRRFYHELGRNSMQFVWRLSADEIHIEPFREPHYNELIEQEAIYTWRGSERKIS